MNEIFAIIGIYVGLGLIYCSRKNYIKIIYRLYLVKAIEKLLNGQMNDLKNYEFRDGMIRCFNYHFGKKSFKKYYLFNSSVLHFFFMPIGVFYNIVFLSKDFRKKNIEVYEYLDFVFDDDVHLNEKIKSNYYYNSENNNSTIIFRHTYLSYKAIEDIIADHFSDCLREMFTKLKNRVSPEK